MIRQIGIPSLLIVLLFSCGQPIPKEHIHALNIDWTKLMETDYQFKYIQLNFDDYPTKENTQINIIDFLDNDSIMILSRSHVEQLQNLITDTTNFSEGECGTFHLNGGIVIMDADTIKGIIEMGCGFGQWSFQPENPNAKWGNFNDKGFNIATKLLDDINIQK